MNNIIKELKLDLGGKEVKLTIEQAKKPKEALDELFGKLMIKEVSCPYCPYHWYWHAGTATLRVA